MLRFKFFFLMGLTLVTFTSAQEKVVFGQPASKLSAGSPAEVRSGGLVVPDSSHQTKDETQSSGRKSRVFSFPGSGSQQESGRSRTSYILAPSVGHSTYEVPSNDFDISRQPISESLSDESRLLSLLPSLGGSNGMQVGLDFKLPFFSIPYAKLFSGLAAPIIGGGGSFFGSNSYGSSAGATGNALGNNFFGSESGLTSSLATMAAMAVTASLLYPKITGVFSPADGKGVFRNANSADDFMQNLNSVLGQFNIDGESCMKVALCSLSNAKIQRPKRGRDANSNTTPSDIIEDLLNLPSVKKSLTKGGLVQARDFGGSGGDCDYFNRENKCPLSSQLFQKMFANIM